MCCESGQCGETKRIKAKNKMTHEATGRRWEHKYCEVAIVEVVVGSLRTFSYLLKRPL
jgi:hypothetical protein